MELLSGRSEECSKCSSHTVLLHSDVNKLEFIIFKALSLTYSLYDQFYLDVGDNFILTKQIIDSLLPLIK